MEKNVSEGCPSTSTCSETKCPMHSDCLERWEHSTCSCHSGWVGSRCSDVCQYDPCENGGKCSRNATSWKGYTCSCDSEEYSGNRTGILETDVGNASVNFVFSTEGEYCERKVDQPCPSSWWGYPVCGPCQCNTEMGYNPDCNRTTGECYCNVRFHSFFKSAWK